MPLLNLNSIGWEYQKSGTTGIAGGLDLWAAQSCLFNRFSGHLAVTILL